MEHNKWVVLVLFFILIPLLIGSCAVYKTMEKESEHPTIVPQTYLGTIDRITADPDKLEQGEYEEIIILTNGDLIYIDTETEELLGYYFPGNELWYWEDECGKHYRGVVK